MPTYDYRCQDCKRDFVVTFSLRDQEARPCVTCPDCKGSKVDKKYCGFTAVTAKKS